MALWNRSSDDVAKTEKSGASTVDVDKLLRSNKVRSDLDAMEALYEEAKRRNLAVELVKEDLKAD